MADGPAVHHGRFAAEDRRRLDQAVGDILRPDPNRVLKGVAAIGAQTLEQVPSRYVASMARMLFLNVGMSS